MKNRILIVAVCMLMSIWSSAQVLRAMTARYNNPSVKGNILFLSNNSITSSGVGTAELPPGGSNTNNNTVGVNLDIDGPVNPFFINTGDTWKYWANSLALAPAATWKNTVFADGGWANGNTQMGYGDGDEATVIGYGADPNNKWTTTYFRKAVNIPNPSLYSAFIINVARDDGFILYINGTEISRDNMPAGAVTWSTFASSNVDDVTITINVPTSAFVAGNNVIAVEVHQSNLNSTDLSFGLTLQGNLNTTLLPFGSNWKYLANNTRPVGWETTGFNDAAWLAGNGYLGYGDTWIVTNVGYGPDANNKYPTTYFRKVINITNPAIYASILMRLRRDDGAVIYINGVEVVRSNMPSGTILHTTLSATTISGAAENANNDYYISPSYFVAGNNTIAVEVHQDALASTDVTFDLNIEGSTDSTFNSTSANLTLGSCTQVLFAGLYWGATQGVDGSNVGWINNENVVKLKLPGAANYTTVTSAQTDYHNGTLVPGLPHTGYRCFSNITGLVNASAASGTYTVANVVAPNGVNNASAGWTIVIVYSDPSTIVRNLTVFDGSVIMNGGDPALTVPISGFLTPPSGPVSCELGAVVFDGDRGSVDEFSFKQNSNPLVGTYTNLTPNTTANINDMWNSTISYKGSVVTSRNPAHNNTLGYDADIIDVPNAANAVLGNSQSSASIRFSSPSENYMIQVATTAISQYTPSFSVSKNATDLTGGALTPNDSIRYQIVYQNGGNDASTATTIIDNIPAGTSYAPNSLVINGVAKTDALGDDEAEYDVTNNRVIFRIGTGANGTTGGEVNPAGNGNVTFKVFTPASCAVFTCNSMLSNRARMSYGGKLSLLSLYDSTGTLISGCNTPGPQVNLMTGTCRPLGDTILTNICPATSVLIPYLRYAGYVFHTGLPFSTANVYDARVAVTTTRVIYGFYDGPGSCDDTIRINVYIIACPDIDDDNDGLPDYLEINDPLALGNHDGDGELNCFDLQYSPRVDNNADGLNDYFDPSADADNDGIPNFYDTNFPGYVDTNGDGVNDRMDADRDGIPNHLDLDSDNDGIPDVAESFGVDANGDGRIDNYTDTDNDGFSQNVDGNSTGVLNSGAGLTGIDTDADGVANYLDKDSDNDGIPDSMEIYGADTNNDGKQDSYIDSDGDGYNDIVDADVGNDAVSENSAAALLRTGPDANSNGRADSWPYNNIDADTKPNAYDLDSDNDGITDVKEAGFTDSNWDGRIDGGLNADGWNSGVAGGASLVLPNTDNSGRANPYDIDSDNDGIPDNVEGLTTAGYLLPAYADADGDGIDNSYDNFSGFGGDGIHPVDKDGDGTPDYLDSDTDGDGLSDLIEGNDLNFNNRPDDNITLTGLDTDGDGLDNFFDNDNATPKATSRYMGNGGSTSGQNPPGSITTVQHSPVNMGCVTERDWRCVFYVLSCDIITFRASLQQQQTRLDWTVLCEQDVNHFVVERSIDRVNFVPVSTINGRPGRNAAESYFNYDNISGLPAGLIYYRLKTVLHGDKEKYSAIIAVRNATGISTDVQVLPNPVKDQLQLLISSPEKMITKLVVVDATGRTVQYYNVTLMNGSNSFSYPVTQLAGGLYYLRVMIGQEMITRKFTVLN
jgi:uncharacterized repeat protein (TIGR01451 family)